MSDLQQRAWDASPEWNGAGGDSPVPKAVVAAVAPEPAVVEAAAPEPVHDAPAPAAPDAPRERFFAGAGVRFKGELEACDDLMLSGRFEGTARARRLIVSREGVFSGTGTVDEAEIEGIAEGTLTVTGALIVRAGGVVRGKIRYGEIELARGARLEGEIAKHEPQAETPAAEAPVAEPAVVRAAELAPVELSTADILAAPEAAPAAPPVPRVLTAEADAPPRKRFGIFGR